MHARQCVEHFGYKNTRGRTLREPRCVRCSRVLYCYTQIYVRCLSPPPDAPCWGRAHVPVTPRRVRNGFAQQALAAEATYSNRVTEREHAAATLDLCTVSASAQARVTTRLPDDSEG